MVEFYTTNSSKVPVEGKRNLLITSSLAVPKDVPHIGNIISGALSADVFARYCRLRGYNTLFVSGTADYDTAIETKAEKEKKTCEQICDKYHTCHRDVYKWFDVSFDVFGRTSTPEQTQICQTVFEKLLENNYLKESTLQQAYCGQCKMFLADRLVEGRCPGCNDDSVWGFQCGKCLMLLNPMRLLSPRCTVCQKRSRLKATNHMLLDLPSSGDNFVKDYIKKLLAEDQWSRNVVRATNANEDLRARCVTRDSKWGISIPHEKFEDKVLYDDLLGYLSITARYTKDWEKWWKNPDNVELYQFMGKDDVLSHTVMFPSTLLGTGESWTLMKTISVSEYLICQTGKFSSSKGVGVSGIYPKETGIPVDAWRYYLLTTRPEVADMFFVWEDVQAKLNSELVKLDRFIYRVLSHIATPRAEDISQGGGFSSIIPDASGVVSDNLTKNFGKRLDYHVEKYFKAMEKVSLKKGLRIAMKISAEGEDYMTDSEYWCCYDDNPDCVIVVMKTLAGLIYLLTRLLEPFMPNYALAIREQLNLHEGLDEICNLKNIGRPWDFVPEGHQIGTPKKLFQKLTDEDVRRFDMSEAGISLKTKEELDSRSTDDWDGIPGRWDKYISFGFSWDLMMKTVRDQGDCPNCVPVSVASSTSNYFRIVTKNDDMPELSPSEIYDCIVEFDPVNVDEEMVCLWSALNYATEVGLVEESLYPYVQRRNVCRKLRDAVRYKLPGWKLISRKDEDTMLLTLLRSSFVLIIMVDDSLCNLGETEIWFGPDPATTRQELTPHAVEVFDAGHDHATGVKFWIAKNSWGRVWGNAGSFMIVRQSSANVDFYKGGGAPDF